MLMVHENIAPFVALRVIQHLVKSDPSPAYLARMATLFRNNGQGVAGDMKTLVKAVLLDREARDGDDPAIARSSDGKVREPHLFHTAVLRALGCQRIPTNGWGSALGSMQNPYWASSVFSFYAATDRAPGSRLLAPEQKLLNASELTSRLVSLANMRWQDGPSPGSDAAFTRGGCDVAQVYAAFAQSPKAFADWTEKRFFRGAMPPPLRRVVEQRVREASAATSDMRHQSALRILSFALTSPSFGAPT